MTPITRRFRTVISAFLIAIALGLLIEALLSLLPGWPFGHTQQGHRLGWLGFSVILTTTCYSLKKRYGHKTSWSKTWFWAHQIAGIIGPLLILVHAGAHFHALAPVLALLAMGIVVISGIVGVAVHRKAISLLNATRQELHSQGLPDVDISSRLFELAAEEESFRVWRMIHVPMAIIFWILALCHISGALYFGGL